MYYTMAMLLVYTMIFYYFTVNICHCTFYLRAIESYLFGTLLFLSLVIILSFSGAQIVSVSENGEIKYIYEFISVTNALYVAATLACMLILYFSNSYFPVLAGVVSTSITIGIITAIRHG